MTGKCPDTINILSTSDWHLGKEETPTLIRNLKAGISKVLLSDKIIVKLLLIGGDIFDKIMTLSDKESILIQDFIIWIFNICSERDVILRVLEGTPSHDRKQSVQFEVIHRAVGSFYPCNFEYIQSIKIEYISEIDTTILYIPDEATSCPDKTLEVVKDLMFNLQIKQVDYAMIHSGLDIHFPPHAHVPMHNSDAYLDIVKKYIFIAHIHQRSVQKKRLITNGSFDRHTHNDEDKKGSWLVSSNKDSIIDDKIYFIENDNALIYKTINVDSDNYQELIDNILKKHSGKIRIRIQTADNVLLGSLKQRLPKEHNRVIWTFDYKGITIKETANVPVVYQPVAINKETILDLVGEKIVGKPNMQSAMDLLSKVVHG